MIRLADSYGSCMPSLYPPSSSLLSSLSLLPVLSLPPFPLCPPALSPSLSFFLLPPPSLVHSAHLIIFPPSPPFSHYKIVVVPNGLTNMNTRTEVPDNTLGPYDENRLSTYAAAAINEADYQRTFIIGDGQTSTLNSMRFVNAPLRANQAYVFFIRLYSSVPVSYSVLARPFWSGAHHLVCLVHYLVASRKLFCTTWFE